jgi:DMSO/TMAO reductase YedYZ molybdopterin-dependent catalytic subunit
MQYLHDTSGMRHLRNFALGLFPLGVAVLLVCVGPPAAQTTGDLKLAVTGDVATPLTLSASDLAAMPREHVDVNDPHGGKASYDGVALQTILVKAGVPFGHMRGKSLTGYVLAEAKDGYEILFSLGELDPDFGNTRVIVADVQDGKPLGPNKGPVRLVVPADKEGARSVRMLEKLEVVQLHK